MNSDMMNQTQRNIGTDASHDLAEARLQEVRNHRGVARGLMRVSMAGCVALLCAVCTTSCTGVPEPVPVSPVSPAAQASPPTLPSSRSLLRVDKCLDEPVEEPVCSAPASRDGALFADAHNE